MRNKNEKIAQTIEASQSRPGKKGDFAMIIEENSPSQEHLVQHSNRTLSSSKRASQVEGNTGKGGV